MTYDTFVLLVSGALFIAGAIMLLLDYIDTRYIDPALLLTVIAVVGFTYLVLGSVNDNLVEELPSLTASYSN